MPICKQCSANFEIDDKDRKFYEKISPEINGKTHPVPEPKLCPACRQQKRLAFYNRRKLYLRKSDYSGKQILSIYSEDKPFKVYEKDIWFSDKWDPMDYGRDYDPNRPFFEQFRELMEAVPCLGLSLLGETVNSEYNNDNYKLKNCYLVFDGSIGHDCYYGETFVDIKDCVDFKYLEKCDLCYECINCENCYGLKYSRFCKTCSESYFLRDCQSCNHCFGCANLQQKNHCIFNEQKTPEEYEKFMKEFNSGSYKAVQAMQEKAEDFFLTQPVRAIHGTHNENAVGDNINHCKNAYQCFDSSHLHDCEYVSGDQVGAKDSWDLDVWGEKVELCYNSCVIGMSLRNVMCGFYVSEGGHDIYYSAYCSRASNNLFGCVGLKHKDHCILNKQYSKEDYDRLIGQIIENMTKDGEWGEFFPQEISWFGYNETVANEYFPLTKEEVLAKGWKWKDETEKQHDIKKLLKSSELPDNIKDAEDLAEYGVECEKSGKPFKLVAQELNYYKKHNIPIPHLHPDERHLKRIALRNPHHLWERKCDKCGCEIQTSYSPERREIVYCENCYRDLVF